MSVPCHEGPHATKGHFSSEPAVAGRGRYYCTRLSRGQPGFDPGSSRELLGVKTWLSTLEIVNLCLSDETVKAVGPFYLVSMPGEVKDPTHGVNV